MRRLVLTEELLALPELIQRLGERVDALIEAHARAEERLSRTEERLGGVEERLSRTEERLDRLEGIVQELAEAQRRTEMRVEELAEDRRKLSGAGVPGPYLVYAYGIRADAGAEKAARTFQIGLITGQGEVVSPGSLLPPVDESMEGCE